MKRMFILLGCIMLMASCTIRHISIDELDTPEQCSKYIQTYSSTSSYSPVEYNVIKGINPAGEYGWTQISVSNYSPKYGTIYTYEGDRGALLKKAFPDADIIMAYGGYYFIGRKKEVD